ncbi:MAG: rRNA maturation RNase YbeY, partial [Planctomycetota bacterium]
VITFPYEDDGELTPGDVPIIGRIIGEIFVSVDTGRREAQERGLVPERELGLYAIHGVLHLVGFDDQSDGDRQDMRDAESRYMERFEIPNESP